jgi:hypothetical protein
MKQPPKVSFSFIKIRLRPFERAIVYPLPPIARKAKTRRSAEFFPRPFGKKKSFSRTAHGEKFLLQLTSPLQIVIL